MIGRKDVVGRELTEQPWHCAVRLLAGPLLGTDSGAAATSVRTQRRKRPPLLPLLCDLLL